MSRSSRSIAPPCGRSIRGRRCAPRSSISTDRRSPDRATPNSRRRSDCGRGGRTREAARLNRSHLLHIPPETAPALMMSHFVDKFRRDDERKRQGGRPINLIGCWENGRAAGAADAGVASRRQRGLCRGVAVRAKPLPRASSGMVPYNRPVFHNGKRVLWHGAWRGTLGPQTPVIATDPSSAARLGHAAFRPRVPRKPRRIKAVLNPR